MALINTTTTGVLGTTIFGDGSGTLTVQENGVTINQISSTGLLNGRLTSMTSQASTSGTSIDFTGIPSWVKRITVMLNGVSTSATSNIQIQIGAGSVTTSGYTCYIGNIDGTNATSITTATSGFIAKAGVSASVLHNGVMVINLLTGNTWSSTNSTSSSVGNTTFSNGSLALGGTLDRVRITTVNGTDTFDAGSINILYE
jgi:hypothetical protein